MRTLSGDRLRWYAARAAAMPPGEWVHRLRIAAAATRDRRRPVAARAVPGLDEGWPRPPGAPVLVDDATTRRVRELPGAVAACARHADPLCEGRLRFFGYDEQVVGPDPDWNLDPTTGYRFPDVHWSRLDYRTTQGDPKWVWEMGRHLHLVTLARAWRLTGDERYAECAVRPLRGFLAQCPPGHGIHWRVGLELGLRLISWCWLMEFLRGSRVCTAELGQALASSADAHMAWIERFPSRYSSANNHRLGELAGLVVGALAFPGLPDAARRYDDGMAALIDELRAQTHPDGGNAEAAVYYHQFVLDLVIATAAAVVRSGRALPPDFRGVMRGMADYSATLASDAGTLPVIGDKDDAVAIDLMPGASEPDRLRSRLRTVSALLATPTARLDPGEDEQSLWLAGPLLTEEIAASERRPGSVVFADSGLAVLRHRGGAGEVRAVLRAGPFGLGPIYAHAHADQLSVCVSIRGEEAVIDAGTFTYYGAARWRAYARSTAAHSTLVVDGRDQATPSGPFLWRETVDGSIDEVSIADGAASVAAHHDGYAPVRHMRALRVGDGTVEVVDTLSGASGPCDVELRWHLAPGDADVADGVVTWRGDTAALTLQVAGLDGAPDVVVGRESPPAGFSSDMLERWHPSPTVIVAGRMSPGDVVTTRIAAVAP